MVLEPGLPQFPENEGAQQQGEPYPGQLGRQVSCGHALKHGYTL
jgi:hypothetical protein